MTSSQQLYELCYDGFTAYTELECCVTDTQVLFCGQTYYDKRLLYAHIFVGLSTLAHAIHSIPVYMAIISRNADYSTKFISLAIGGAISYGVQILLLPFTFVRDPKWKLVREIYTGATIWGGGVGGWIVTGINLIVLIYWEITPTVEDFTRSIGPYIVGEFILWISYYVYQKQSF